MIWRRRLVPRTPKEREKVDQLYRALGKRLKVVTDQSINSTLPIPLEQVVSPQEQSITESQRFNFLCCALERAMMYLISHQREYRYAWVIEDDVHWTDTSLITTLMRETKHFPVDLLHTNNKMSVQHYHLGWQFRHLHSPQVSSDASFSFPYNQGIFPFYRISRKFVRALDEWKNRNGGHWTFLEPLLATMAGQGMSSGALSHMTVADTRSSVSISVRYRPCFSREEVSAGGPGLYHPVKQNFSQCS